MGVKVGTVFWSTNKKFDNIIDDGMRRSTQIFLCTVNVDKKFTKGNKFWQKGRQGKQMNNRKTKTQKTGDVAKTVF